MPFQKLYLPYTSASTPGSGLPLWRNRKSGFFQEKSLDTLEIADKGLWRDQRWLRIQTVEKEERLMDIRSGTLCHFAPFFWKSLMGQFSVSLSLCLSSCVSLLNYISSSHLKEIATEFLYEVCFLGRSECSRASVIAVTFTTSILERKKYRKMVQAEGRKVENFYGLIFSSLFYF